MEHRVPVMVPIDEPGIHVRAGFNHLQTWGLQMPNMRVFRDPIQKFGFGGRVDAGERTPHRFGMSRQKWRRAAELGTDFDQVCGARELKRACDDWRKRGHRVDQQIGH